MGRYYSGDIEGKFWFAVQDSDDADHFGIEGEVLEDEDGEESGEGEDKPEEEDEFIDTI